MDSTREKEIAELARQIRIDVLKMCERTGTGHVGSSFSVADILAVLYSGVLHGVPSEPDRDRLILSKGHACTALYSVLYHKGIIPKKRFLTFSVNGTSLGNHAHFEPKIGLEMNTGSLGHGLPVGAGLAFAGLLQGSPSRIYVIMSDGEVNEGTVWEAAAFAAHQKLSNLCVIIDANKIQALGNTKDIIDPGDYVSRWAAFGWRTDEVDGHNIPELWSVLSDTERTEKPRAIIAHTVKGKGVSFMENTILWHYRKPQGEEFKAALKELS